MASKAVASELLTSKLRGREVSQIVAEGSRKLTVHFSDGTTLVVGATELFVTVGRSGAPPPDKSQPTKRQHQYLVFIAKYNARFGRPPAESDIGRHFLVSAPSVNQMMQTLERKGFITRQPGVPRSTRICVGLSDA